MMSAFKGGGDWRGRLEGGGGRREGFGERIDGKLEGEVGWGVT